MPNARQEQLSGFQMMESDPYLTETDDAEATSMLEAASIVDQYEIEGYDFEEFEGGELIAVETGEPAAGIGLGTTTVGWLKRLTLRMRQAGLAAAPEGELADPLYRTRQVYSTVAMDAEWLEHFQKNLPDWAAITKRVGALLHDFRDTLGEERVEEANLCGTTLTKYFERSLEISRFEQDAFWRWDNLVGAARGFPPYVVLLAERWTETIRMLGLPLAGSLAYWGVEKTVACTLEISKHAKDPRTSEYAAGQFKLLEEWRLRKDLVASVTQTRQLLLATGTFARETAEFGEALGPYVGWAWQLLSNAWTDLLKVGRAAGKDVGSSIQPPATSAEPAPTTTTVYSGERPPHPRPLAGTSEAPHSPRVSAALEGIEREVRKLADALGEPPPAESSAQPGVAKAPEKPESSA